MLKHRGLWLDDRLNILTTAFKLNPYREEISRSKYLFIINSYDNYRTIQKNLIELMRVVWKYPSKELNKKFINWINWLDSNKPANT